MDKPNLPLNAAYDDYPVEYDSLRRCWLNERRLMFLAKQLGSSTPDRVRNVLEIGSGTGWLLLRLAVMFPEISFWGIEPLAKYCEYSESSVRTPNVRFLNGTAECVDKLALPRMDVVLSNDVLHHVSRMDRTVVAISRVANPGCVWHTIEPNYLNIYSLLRQATTPGERVFWPWQFSGLAQKQRWRKQRTQHLFLIPPFVREATEGLKTLERRLEWIPMLAGGIYMRFEFAGLGDPR